MTELFRSLQVWWPKFYEIFRWVKHYNLPRFMDDQNDDLPIPWWCSIANCNKLSTRGQEKSAVSCGIYHHIYGDFIDEFSLWGYHGGYHRNHMKSWSSPTSGRSLLEWPCNQVGIWGKYNCDGNICFLPYATLDVAKIAILIGQMHANATTPALNPLCMNQWFTAVPWKTTRGRIYPKKLRLFSVWGAREAHG